MAMRLMIGINFRHAAFRRSSDSLPFNAIRASVLSWLVPILSSLRHGAPDYAQLHNSCPQQIRTGASDESEMGAFHDLFQPQRETNLKLRLEEYLRFGMEASIFYET